MVDVRIAAVVDNDKAGDAVGGSNPIRGILSMGVPTGAAAICGINVLVSQPIAKQNQLQ
jgi:hypothetical protein